MWKIVIEYLRGRKRNGESILSGSNNGSKKEDEEEDSNAEANNQGPSVIVQSPVTAENGTAAAATAVSKEQTDKV